MGGREFLDQKARGAFVRQRVHGTSDIAPYAIEGNGASSTRNGHEHALDSMNANGNYEASGRSSQTLTLVDAAKLIQTLQQLEGIAKRQAPRIAIKARGKILVLDVADIVSVEAQGNYISLKHGTNSYLLREPLSCMAEKLKPYGFMRIHRSVVVNTSTVEEIQPLPSGEYRLRVKGGKEYLVTRTYKHNLKDLAQLWVGSEQLSG